MTVTGRHRNPSPAGLNSRWEPVVPVIPEVPEVRGWTQGYVGDVPGRVYLSPCCARPSFAAEWRVEYARRRDGWIRMGCGEGQARRNGHPCPGRFLAQV